MIKMSREQSVEYLFKRLSLAGYQERMNACSQLGHSGDWCAFNSLINTLGDRSYHVRRAAAEALTRISNASAVEPQIKIVEKDDTKVQRTVPEILSQIKDKRAIQSFINALDCRRVYTRKSITEALVLLGVQSVEPLIKALKDKRIKVRHAATEILGQIGDTRAIGPLIQLLGDRNPGIREAAANVLDHLGEPIGLQLLRSLRGDKHVMAELAKSKNDCVVDPLIKMLCYKVVRKAAAQALGRIGNSLATKSLIKILMDRRADLRRTASVALGRIGDALAVNPLIRVLGDANPRVRTAAARALGKIRDPRSVKSLIIALGDNDPNMRRTVAEVLGRIGDIHAIDPLVRLLSEDANSQARIAATRALGRIHSVWSVEPLITALGDKDPNVRRIVAEVLGRFGDVRAIGPLVQVLGDCVEVREAAAVSLEHLGEPIGLLLLRVLRGDRQAIEELIKRKDYRVVYPLISTLSHSDKKVCGIAVKALKTIWQLSHNAIQLFLCPKHLARFEKKAINVRNLLFNSEVYYLACRVCGKSWPVKEVWELVAVLDRESEQEQIEDGEALRINWFLRHELFDFDRVEIRAATETQVERFVMQVKNDIDEFRRKRYKNISCIIDSNSKLSEHSLRMLRSVFGSVENV